MDSCVIEADGTMTASGTVTNDNDDQVTARVTVVFEDAETKDMVDRSFVDDLKVDGKDTADWEATGSAGDEVQRITCLLDGLTTG